MHIPDGMLSTPVWASGWAGALGFLGYGLRAVRKRFAEKKIVLMAVLAALIFALQMLNFPVAGGTSGHFAGGAAAAIVLGPWPAVVVMSTVLLIQALVFADGGVTAFGANVLNMAIIGPFVGWWVYGLVVRLRGGRAAKAAGAFVGAWAATVAGACGAAVEVWASGAAPFGLVVGSMAFWHALIGIGEGVITASLVAYLLAVRPDLLSADATPGRAGPAVLGLGLAALAAAGVSFLASSYPDGLESVAHQIGFAGSGRALFTGSLLPDYVVPGVANETLAGVLAGAVGVIITGLLVYGLLIAVRSRRQSGAGPA